jgi:CheY-like chemotaxis protein
MPKATRPRKAGEAKNGPIVAAVFNTSPDIVDLVRRALEPAGIVTITLLTYQVRDGEVDLEGFLGQHDPQVVIYDIAPPYDANWQLFRHIRSLSVMRDRKVVITSMNRRHVENLVGKDETIYEIVGKPYDLGLLVQAVKEAARSRPTR